MEPKTNIIPFDALRAYVLPHVPPKHTCMMRQACRHWRDNIKIPVVRISYEKVWAIERRFFHLDHCPLVPLSIHDAIQHASVVEFDVLFGSVQDHDIDIALFRELVFPHDVDLRMRLLRLWNDPRDKTAAIRYALSCLRKVTSRIFIILTDATRMEKAHHQETPVYIGDAPPCMIDAELGLLLDSHGGNELTSFTLKTEGVALHWTDSTTVLLMKGLRSATKLQHISIGPEVKVPLHRTEWGTFYCNMHMDAIAAHPSLKSVHLGTFLDHLVTLEEPGEITREGYENLARSVASASKWHDFAFQSPLLRGSEVQAFLKTLQVEIDPSRVIHVKFTSGWPGRWIDLSPGVTGRDVRTERLSKWLKSLTSLDDENNYMVHKATALCFVDDANTGMPDLVGHMAGVDDISPHASKVPVPEDDPRFLAAVMETLRALPNLHLDLCFYNVAWTDPPCTMPLPSLPDDIAGRLRFANYYPTFSDTRRDIEAVCRR